MRLPIMVTKSQQTDFSNKFDNALWHILFGKFKENPDIYYSGQMELLRLCKEYISAWEGGFPNGFIR